MCVLFVPLTQLTDFREISYERCAMVFNCLHSVITTWQMHVNVR